MNLSDYFAYDESSPTCLVNKTTRGSKAIAGHHVKRSLNINGYCRVGINRSRRPVHQIVWELHYGAIPDGYEIDHIDGDKLNNRIANLRLATHQQNLCNTSKHGRRLIPSLPKGITRHTLGNGSYVAEIACNGARYRKCSKDIYSLIKWLRETRNSLHGEFARS